DDATHRPGAPLRSAGTHGRKRRASGQQRTTPKGRAAQHPGNASQRNLNRLFKRKSSWLSLEAEQLRRIAAEDIGLFGVAERRRGEDVIHRVQLPWIGVIA